MLHELGHEVRFVTVLNGSSISTDTVKSYTVEADFDIIAKASNDHTEWLLEPDHLDQLAKHEGRFITLASRYAISPKAWSAQDISEVYYLLCNYWYKILKTKQIEAIFSQYVPHEPSSFSLYILSKILKVPYIFVDPATVGGKLKHLSCSVKHRDLLVARNHAPEAIKLYLKKYMTELRRDFGSQTPPFMRDVYKENYFSLAFSVLKDLEIILRSLIRDLTLRRRIMPALGFFKTKRFMWGHKKAHFNFHVSYSIFALMQNIRLHFEKNRYEKLCTTELPEKFIYFSAPLEPEASNQPLADNFKHLRIILSMLNDAIKDDMKVVFKISPAQFTGRAAPNSTFIKWLPIDFYANLKKLDKLVFIKADAFPTDKLIDRSECVAAINGTVAFEAIARSKHCITFASMWFNQFDGIHQCASLDDVSYALALINTKLNTEEELDSLQFSSQSSFFISSYVANDFLLEDIKGMVTAFDESLTVFQELPEEKWKI